MTKRASHKETANPRAAVRSRAALPERQSSLGAHICIQREASGLGVQPHAPVLVRDVLNSPGQPLDSETRAIMEPQLGHDFSGVRVHTDDKASESARALSARAYTAGSHIAFASQKYSPRTSDGQTLLAHELTHVVQQASGPVGGVPISPGMSVSTSNDSFEQHAAAHAGSLRVRPSGLPKQPEESGSRSQVPKERIQLQRLADDTASGITSAAFGGLGAVFGGIGLIAAFQSARAGERQADAAEYQAAGGFAFDSYSFGPFLHEGSTVPLPGVGKQGGPDEGADELPAMPLIQIVAGDANEAIIELTLRTNGKDIFGGIIEQGDSRGYGGGPRGASGNLVFTGASQLANAGDVAIAALHFRGTNHPAGKPVQRFHGRIVLGANGVVYRVECSHTSGMEGVVADCNSERRPPIIVGSGRKALQDNPASGEMPAQRRARASKGAPGENPPGSGTPKKRGGEDAGDSGPEPPGRRNAIAT